MSEGLREVPIDGIQLMAQFHEEGLKRTSQLIYGEEEAQLALLLAHIPDSVGDRRIANGVIFGGPPGTGKTGLVENAYRFIIGADESNVARIPVDDELTEREVYGAEVTSYHKTDRKSSMGNETIEESTTHSIESAVTPNTLIIDNDEGPRKSERSQNALLRIIEDGKVYTPGGYLEVPRLLYMATTLNPAERGEAHLPSKALISRHALGAIVGFNIAEDDEWKLAQRQYPDATKIDAFVKESQIDMMADTLRGIRLPDKYAREWLRSKNVAEKQLYEHLGIIEKGRMVGQVGSTAVKLAAFDGTAEVNKYHWSQALRFALGARVCAFTSNIMAAPEILDNMHRASVQNLF